MSDQPIADHALISDSHSCALVDRAGSVEWLCFPRFDSPSIYARLLDDGGGHFSLRPRSHFTARRRYLDGTLVLVTTFESAGGAVEIIDALAMAENVRGHRLREGSPHVLLRRVRA